MMYGTTNIKSLFLFSSESEVNKSVLEQAHAGFAARFMLEQAHAGFAARFVLEQRHFKSRIVCCGHADPLFAFSGISRPPL